MNDFSIISDRLEQLRNLAQKDIIGLEDVSQEFRNDITTFIVGHTLTMYEGKIVISNTLYRQWLDKVHTRGFDYEIKFK